MGHVTTLVAVRDDQLIHPDTERAIRRYLPGAESAIGAVLERARAAISLWGVSDLVPLGGGAQSVVVAGRVDGARVVVKVPIVGQALDEARVLSVMPTAPKVLVVTATALLLEHIEGTVVSSDDGVRVGEALVAISPMRDADVTPFIPWSTYLYGRIGEFGGRIIERSDSPELVALARRVIADMARLTAPQLVVAAHGDLQGRNLLAGVSGVRVLDPTGILSPPGWEAAFSAMSVAAFGGDPAPVLSAAEDLGVDDVGKWLHVAAVAIAGSTVKVINATSCARVLALLD